MAEGSSRQATAKPPTIWNASAHSLARLSRHVRALVEAASRIRSEALRRRDSSNRRSSERRSHDKIVHFRSNSILRLQPDRLPIAVARLCAAASAANARRIRRKRSGKPAPPSEWTLVFDTETTVDAAQRLRIGAYQFRKGDELDEAGLFYDPAALISEPSWRLPQAASRATTG